MEWRKYTVQTKFSFLIPSFAILIIFFSFYSERSVLFFIGILLGIYSFFSYQYERVIGNRLQLKNSKNQKYIFCQQQTDWELTFLNKGLPIIGGNITIIYDKNVQPLQLVNLESLNSYHMKIPFSIGTNQELVLKIPVVASFRGVAKIRSIEIVVPHLIGFGQTILEYHAPFLTELIVYPKSKEVENISHLQSIKMGEVPVRQSLFFDSLVTIGSRDYVSSDSFKQINWKATAKMQKLQTKIFEPIADSGIHFSLNSMENNYLCSNFEEKIEYLTYLIYFLHKKNIPYSISINFKSKGSLPFYYLSKGSGKSQLQLALRLLATVDQLFLPMPFNQKMNYYYKHLNDQPYIFHIGQIDEPTKKIYQQLKQSGVTLFYLDEINRAIHPMKIGGEKG